MLKKLRSIFVIEEETPKTTNSAAGSSDSAAATPRDVGSAETAASATVEIKDGQVNEKFLTILLEAMEKSNLAGFDYMEFKQFLKSLDSVELDEATKFRSAFATGQTMGATKENLLSSARRYLDILKKEEERFGEAVKNQRSKIIDEKEAGITMLGKSIAEKEAQIAKLSEEIEKAKAEIHQRKEDVALAQAKVQQTKSDFEHTYHLLIGQLQEDIRKITSYIT